MPECDFKPRHKGQMDWCAGPERHQTLYLAVFCMKHYALVTEAMLESEQCLLGEWGTGETPLRYHHWQTIRAEAKRKIAKNA